MKQTSSQLAAVLRDMADSIERDDSFEGNITYSCMAEGLERREFEVSGAYRIGNSEGQGGMRILEASEAKPAEQREAEQIPHPVAEAEQSPQPAADVIDDARNVYIEGYIAGWGDIVTQDVMVMAVKAWDASESRTQVEALAQAPTRNGKGE